MTETSVIKHYKKQLIYRQHDVPDANKKHTPQLLNEVSNMIYGLDECGKNKNKNDLLNGKKVRKKRKNKICRGQFRHEGMELIKLGTNSSNSLCKTKEPFTKSIEKPQSINPTPNKYDQNVPHKKSESIHKESTNTSLIHSNCKTILENPQSKQPQYGHTLPQMVPERRNSKEISTKVPVIYTTPPQHSPLSEYRVPMHPTYPYNHPLPFPTTPKLPYPPPYPIARSPPRPVPRSPIRPIPQPAFHRNPYFINKQPEVTNGYHHHEPPTDFSEGNKRRKHEQKGNDKYPVVAAIDLTVDHNEKVTNHHKCKCECGKTYADNSVTQEVIITVKDSDNSQVPSTLQLRGKMVNGVLQFDQQNAKNLPPKSPKPNKVPAQTNPEMKLPPLFLIEDLLAKKKKPRQDSEKDKISVPIRTEANRVIVSPRSIESVPKTKLKDHSVRTIIGSDNRRQSVDVDTISIGSSGSESVRSPGPKPNTTDKQIPHGKLFYYKNNNSFIRYFDDTQKKLFIDNITSDGKRFEKFFPEDKEVIELPKHTIFSSKDNLMVEEYVSEMTLVEKYIPRDFFLFYKFVTGYQICNNNLPVSFLTFLKVYNTNGLKVLLERYINSLK